MKSFDCTLRDEAVEGEIVVIGQMHCAQTANGLKPIGCHLCYHQSVEWDDLGEPCLGGLKLSKVPSELPTEAAANLWSCPHCGMIISSLMRQFQIV